MQEIKGRLLATVAPKKLSEGLGFLSMDEKDSSRSLTLMILPCILNNHPRVS